MVRHNPYIDRQVEFEFFFTRKTILRKNSVAYVLMPEEFGTMDEIFEVLTLILCMGKDYWIHIQKFIRETMIRIGTISPEDLD